MNSEIFSRNLRRLRLQKNLTQEQLANLLGVSVQSVSRWECGNTLPDVMLLPVIAKLYGVIVDDLYRADATGYPSYAQRLLAVYEASGWTEDFLAAEQEFARMPANELTADDFRAWGVLYHYMMKYSALQAQRKLEQAMFHPDVTEQVWSSAAQQKIVLLCDQGKGHEEAQRYDRELAADPNDYRDGCSVRRPMIMPGRMSRHWMWHGRVWSDSPKKHPCTSMQEIFAAVCAAMRMPFPTGTKRWSWTVLFWMPCIPWAFAMKNWNGTRRPTIYGRSLCKSWTAEVFSLSGNILHGWRSSA